MAGKEIRNKRNMDIRTVGIAGAGTMGAGIAQVCAQAGYKVLLFDINSSMLETARQSVESSLEKLVSTGKLDKNDSDGTISRLSYTSLISDMKADLIIEAIIEKTEPKVELFRQLIELNGKDTIYATNTSSIPITQIAARVSLPQNVIGIHFFNPARIMKLVEVIKGAKTDGEIVNIVYEFVLSLKKEPVIAADSPGFIVNRIARLYYVEALKILEENVADLTVIDKIMESSGFRMGPFRLMDLIGVDTNYSVTESQYQLFNYEPRFKPSRIQKQKVDAGLHGKKTNEGFYKYE
jgi:3-hydroxybutyryl-CoA dehydrogenase